MADSLNSGSSGQCVYEWTGSGWQLLEHCGSGTCEDPEEYKDMRPDDGKTIVAIPCKAKRTAGVSYSSGTGEDKKLNYDAPGVKDLTDEPRNPDWPAR
jgi:hypothetical protein